MFTRIDYVILYVEDVARSAEFYRDVIGLRLTHTAEEYAEFRLDNCKLGLFSRSRAQDLLRGDPPPAGASEILFLTNDVDAEATRLRGLGVELLSGPEDRAWGHRTIHLVDPDGHVVEIAQETRR